MKVVAWCRAFALAFTACFVMRTALGGSFAIFSAHLRAAMSASPSGAARHLRVLEVRTRAERASAGEDDGLSLEIVGEAARGFRHLQHQLPRQGIAPIAAIHGDDRNGPFAHNGDKRSDFGFEHSQTI